MTKTIAQQQARPYADIEQQYIAAYRADTNNGGEPANSGLSKEELVKAAVRTAKNYTPSDQFKGGSGN
jgi:hypothetical protein